MNTLDNATKEAIVDFANDNPLCTISSVNDDGTPHGAIVYYCTADADSYYMLTKRGTHKWHNLSARPNLALTSVNNTRDKSLQVSGTAIETTDTNELDFILHQMAQAQKGSSSILPPIAKIQAGEYVAVKIKPTYCKFTDYSDR